MDKIIRTSVEENDSGIIKKQVMNKSDDGIIRHQVLGITDTPPVEPVIESLSVTENGTYTVEEGVDGFNPVTVNVPQTTVSSITITENGTYNAPEGSAYSPIVVNVSAPTSEIVANFDYTSAEYDIVRSVTTGEDKEKYNIYAINNFVYENNGMTAKTYWTPSYTFEQLNDYETEITFGSFANCSTTSNKVVICGIMNKSPYGISTTVSGGQATVSHCELFYNYSEDKWYIASTITGVSSNTEIVGSSGLNYFENKTIKIKIEWKNIFNDIQNIYELYETITLIDGNNSYIMFKNFMPSTHVVQELFNNENLFIGTYEGSSTSRLENFVLEKVKITKIKSNIGGN